jgi:hypothetical protein
MPVVVDMQPEAVTLADHSRLDYFDSQTVAIPKSITALEAWSLISEQTGPGMRLAFKIRDVISALFGVRRIGGFSGVRRDNVTAGDHLDFFLVERIEPNVLILTARDNHLDVMTCVNTGAGSVSITASVVTKNFFGRLYMLPVGLAHRRIVRNSLQRLKQTMP